MSVLGGKRTRLEPNFHLWNLQQKAVPTIEGIMLGLWERRMIAHASRPVRADTTATFWLERLKEAHVNLLGVIEELARLTRGPIPDEEVLVSVRWRVSEASLSRRLLWGRIHAYLSRRVDSDVERNLRQLQETDIRLIRASAAHVGQWTTDAIISDWPGYCEASELMRRKMIEAIAEERRLLYPILNSFERHLHSA